MRVSTCWVTSWLPLQVTRTPGYLGAGRLGWALGAVLWVAGAGVELINKSNDSNYFVCIPESRKLPPALTTARRMTY
jgi:hypothetical protein